MRFFTTSILLVCLLLATAPGCQNASLQCRRETALLRAEILDLEDKYYALQSQQRTAMQGGNGNVISNGVIGSGVVVGSQVMGSPVYDSYPVLEGDVIYEDQMLPGSVPMMQAPMEGEIYYEESLPERQPMMLQGVEPTPATTDPESFNLDLDSTPSSPNAVDAGDAQTLVLPDAPELQIGYEDLELDALSDGEVDRIEIVSSGTRGKDLDRVAGDDGIELMVQTLDANGDFVDIGGEMTVTVRDQLVGEIGKWTFLPSELKLFLSRDELGNTGTLLHLPWTDRVPVSKQVNVRVSMIVDGMEYIASRKVSIKPPTGDASDDTVSGWTVSDTRWVNDAQLPSSRGRNESPVRLPTTPSTAIKRPQWKPVR